MVLWMARAVSPHDRTCRCTVVLVEQTHTGVTRNATSGSTPTMPVFSRLKGRLNSRYTRFERAIGIKHQKMSPNNSKPQAEAQHSHTSTSKQAPPLVWTISLPVGPGCHCCVDEAGLHANSRAYVPSAATVAAQSAIIFTANIVCDNQASPRLCSHHIHPDFSPPSCSIFTVSLQKGLKSV